MKPVEVGIVLVDRVQGVEDAATVVLGRVQEGELANDVELGILGILHGGLLQCEGRDSRRRAPVAVADQVTLPSPL